LWADIDVPESQASRVSPGQRVVLKVDARRSGVRGQHPVCRPIIDPEPEPSGLGRPRQSRRHPPGPTCTPAPIFRQPRVFRGIRAAGAVQEAKGIQIVFLPVSASEFETRRVRTSPSDGELVAVLEGLHPGTPSSPMGASSSRRRPSKRASGQGAAMPSNPSSGADSC
jgi:hypothetical protein